MKEYYVKNVDTLCAYIRYNEETDKFSMEIIDPIPINALSLKVCLNDKMTRDWIDKRVTPTYQKGYEELVSKSGFDVNDKDHRLKMFFKHRGTNAKDLTWISESLDESFEGSYLWEALYGR